MAVALTGHRFIPYDKVPSLRQALRTVILEHYNRGIRIFYCGMAMGFDLLAAETALSMKEVYSDITLVAAVPYCGQCEKFTPYNKERYRNALTKADEVVILNESYVDGCFLQRNDYMLSCSACLIAYFDGVPKGGTYFKRARQRGMSIVNLNQLKYCCVYDCTEPFSFGQHCALITCHNLFPFLPSAPRTASLPLLPEMAPFINFPYPLIT